ncbi:uncharacterized protein LOC110840742 [Zootermopsis nevadensis]|uniref:uncharacterized protein LOC110840742 n=1 Tax=Zootermopsis nevadensis TaxID=136037 RepID=UPI000B8E3941|nr:uncharacterized protein LOC110840742 [Zootermopsis nevadensis]
MREYAAKCKERDTLEADCQLLKDQMDKAGTKSSKIRDTLKDIEAEECPLLISSSSWKGVESVEQRTGKHEEICVAYCERKTEYEQIVEDMKNLEKGLTIF